MSVCLSKLKLSLPKAFLDTSLVYKGLASAVTFVRTLICILVHMPTNSTTLYILERRDTSSFDLCPPSTCLLLLTYKK